MWNVLFVESDTREIKFSTNFDQYVCFQKTLLLLVRSVITHWVHDVKLCVLEIHRKL